MSSFKKSLIKFIIPAAIAVFLIFAVSIKLTNRENLIAFYGIEKNEIEEIEKVINSEGKNQKVKYSYVTLNPDESLEKQKNIAKQAVLLFLPSGVALNSAFEHVSDSKAVPLLRDFIQIGFVTESSISPITTWRDFETRALESKSPVIFDGKNSEFFIDILGAITEAIYGTKEYEKAAEILKKYSGEGFPFQEELIAKELAFSTDAPLAGALSQMKSWLKKGVISEKVFESSLTDLDSMLKTGLSKTVFTKLSDIKKLSNESAKKLSFVYFPSMETAPKRTFTSMTICAQPVKKTRNVTSLIKTLTQKDTQISLAKATGLAPLSADFKTADIASDDVSFWLSSTAAPKAGLSREAFYNHENMTKLAKELISKITDGNE